MGEEEPGAEGEGGKCRFGSPLKPFAILCFNCDTRAGNRINVYLRVLQTVTPRGCGTPIMRVSLSFLTPPKPAKLVTSIPSAEYQMQFKPQAKPPVCAISFLSS